ncbi:MAG: glutathione S-transferase family protein [Phenylobacterium sp.]
MKLYDTPLAPNPRRVRWFMAEKGIEDVEIVRINIMDGDHKTNDYIQRFGLANIPALELDDGTCITESLAICRYLESRYPQGNLFGATPDEAAVIEMWTRRGELLVAWPLMLAVRHTHPALARLETQDPAVAEANRTAGLRGLKILYRKLRDHEWLAGDRLTIADIVAFIGIDFTRMIKLEIPAELEGLHRWLTAMRARAAASVAV